MHRGLAIAAAMAALVAGGTEALALDAMSIIYGPIAPSAYVVEYNDQEGRNTNDNGDEYIASEWTSSQHRIWGQSFRHNASFVLDSITLKLNNAGDGTANVEGKSFNMKVFSLDNMNDATPNTILLDATGNMPASMSTGIAYMTFDFAGEVVMVADQQYGFTVDFAAEDPANTTWFRESQSDSDYPNGLELLSIDGGTNWNTVTDAMAFWVVQTPEPGTISLLALGGLAVLRRRSRRK